MSTVLQQQAQPLIGRTAYYAATGTFFGLAVIAAAARAVIRIHYLKRINVDDYLFFVALATLIAGVGLFFAYIGTSYTFYAVAEGKVQPPLDFLQEIENASTYAEIAELLCWTTIFMVKFSFLFYFRALVNKLPVMEVWWWFNLVLFVPIAGIMIPGTFIVCPHTGSSVIEYCSTSNPIFLRREHAFLYFTAASDIVTDIMLITIPVIVLRKASFNLRRKLSIGAVLCLSLLMIAIGLVRAISAGARGTEDQTWNSFWVQMEASISVIAVCPTAYRSLFLINNSTPDETPDRNDRPPGQGSVLERFWRRTKPSLQSIKVSATMTGVRTMIRGAGKTQLGSQDDDGYALSSVVTQYPHSSLSLETSKRGAGAAHEQV